MLESYLISVGIKSTVLLATGLLCLRLLRGRDAAVRHLVCLAALGSAALAPLLALWSPQWSLLISVPAGADAARGAREVANSGPNWPTTLAVLWALGVCIMLVRVVGGWVVLWRARRSSVHFQNNERAEVRIADVSTPLTCGVLRPLILLPVATWDWDAPRLSAVLLHEGAHVQRRDCLAKYVAQAVRALLWWNPLAWMLAGRMDQEQELACDEAVLSAGVAPEDYAQTLLDAARECSSRLLLGCAMRGSSALRARLEHLFEWRQEARRTTRRTALAVPLLLALMTGVSCAEKRMAQTSIIALGTSIVQIAPGTSIVPQARHRVPNH
jgi:beta-lactamase regulating signal transducer with metallopeptidase domain